MYKCPKCGHNVQWRAPSVYGTGNYWICSQCGYSPKTTNVSSISRVNEIEHNDQQKTTEVP